MLSHGREAILPFNQHVMPTRLLKELSAEALEAAANSDGALTVPMTAADESRVPAARHLHGKMSQVYAEAKQSLAVARHRQQQQTDRHRKDNSLLYPVGGKALLSTKDINLRLPPGGTKKLMPRYVGPFDILERIGPVAYRLNLPLNFKGIHNVFHVSRMHPWREDGKRKPPPPESFELDGEPHWNVEKILAHEHRLVGNKVKTFFTIKWEDFSDEADTVEPAAMLDNCPDPLREYSESLRAQGRSLEPPGDLLQRAAQAAGRRGRRRAGRGAAPPSPTPMPLAEVPASRSGRPLKRPVAVVEAKGSCLFPCKVRRKADCL